MAKERSVAAANVASMNPDDMLAGGLPDDFDGTITKARFVRWDYEGKIDEPVLAVALTITPDEGQDLDEFVQHYSAGSLGSFVPSNDGESEEDEGVYAMKVGAKAGLNNNTNWATFVTHLLDANFPKDQLTPSLECFEGIHGHFNRVPQKKRSGIVTQAAEGQQRRSNDILVITQVSEAPTKGKAKTAGTTASKPSGSTGQKASGGDLDAQLTKVVIDAAKAAGDDGIRKSKLAGIVLKEFSKSPQKSAALKRVGDEDFLSSIDGVAFDSDSGTIIAV